MESLNIRKAAVDKEFKTLELEKQQLRQKLESIEVKQRQLQGAYAELESLSKTLESKPVSTEEEVGGDVNTEVIPAKLTKKQK